MDGDQTRREKARGPDSTHQTFAAGRLYDDPGRSNETFIAIAEEKTFTAGAKRVHVTQAAVSMQIRKLEEELDVLIFDRGKQPIEPTPIGKRIIDQQQNGGSKASQIV